jgi:hypothetical protein
MNLLGDNIDTIKKNTQTFIYSSNDTEQTKYVLLSHHQKADEYHNIKMGNRWFENVA